ncbi:hypothetical protein FQA39_LY01398 [Lamprigera yunnana]|nr:hypothetical protein FQA39_LY01398 [Lamprigera yunnana]
MDTINLEFWMTNLPAQLRQWPLINLAIPGSHDSMTANITRSSKLAPDAEVILKRLRWLGPILRAFMYKWCRTQNLNTVEQLKSGIRYFDLRVATKPGSTYPYFVHGLYSNEIVSSLNDFRDFVETHPDEVLILDFQHFYSFSDLDHNNLVELINVIFKDKLLPRSNDLKHVSLNFMTSINKYQVIVIYRKGNSELFLWPGNFFPTPWPATVSKADLIQKLDNGLAHRRSDIAYISQFLLTPTNWFVFKNFYSSLKKKCVLPLQNTKLDWINRQKIGGEKGINIVIGDFIDIENNQFMIDIIELNFKHSDSSLISLTPIETS